MKIVVLLSGGLDSTVAMYKARSSFQKAEILPLFVQYGQRTGEQEARAASMVVEDLAISGGVTYPLETMVVDIPGSSLTDVSQKVPRNRTIEERVELPSTYVPARNLVLLSLATSYAERMKAKLIYVGFNASGPEDKLGWRIQRSKVSEVHAPSYPDSTVEFWQAFQSVLHVTSGILISAPIAGLSKRETFQLARELGVNVENTWSCYIGPEPCMECDACMSRIRASKVD